MIFRRKEKSFDFHSFDRFFRSLVGIFSLWPLYSHFLPIAKFRLLILIDYRFFIFHPTIFSTKYSPEEDVRRPLRPTLPYFILITMEYSCCYIIRKLKSYSTKWIVFRHPKLFLAPSSYFTTFKTMLSLVRRRLLILPRRWSTWVWIK